MVPLGNRKRYLFSSKSVLMYFCLKKGTFLIKKFTFLGIPRKVHFLIRKEDTFSVLKVPFWNKNGVKIDAFLYKLMYFGQKRYLFH